MLVVSDRTASNQNPMQPFIFTFLSQNVVGKRCKVYHIAPQRRRVCSLELIQTSWIKFIFSSLFKGIPRLSKEEKKDGNFPIFNDPDKRYSTFNLKYTHEIFDRLSGLVEFNTALNEQLIRDTIAECVLRRRALNQWTNSPSDVPGCGRTTRILKKFLRHIHMTFYSNQRKEK